MTSLTDWRIYAQMEWNAYERWVSSFFINLLYNFINCEPKENITTIKQVWENSKALLWILD